MRLLIVGGTGFVSGWLARTALMQGHEVWAITRGVRKMTEGVRPIIADRNDGAQLRQALEKENVQFDAVMDCICFNAEQAEIDLSVFSAFSKRIVVISTDSVYHPDYKKIMQDETVHGYMQDGSYGDLKRQMEMVFENDNGKRMDYTILRPGHIFGPGSELGCFPEHTRQKDLLSVIRNGEKIRLVGGGKYLIHPIYVEDLVRVMLDTVANEKTYNQIFCIGGADIVENARYYEILGEIMERPVSIETVDEEGYLDSHPQYSGHLCHRAYCMDKLAATGISLPGTKLYDGLKKQVEALLLEGR